MNRNTNYKFSFSKMLSLNGNTAPYLLYAYARIRGIQRRVLRALEEERCAGELRLLPSDFATDGQREGSPAGSEDGRPAGSQASHLDMQLGHLNVNLVRHLDANFDGRPPLADELMLVAPEEVSHSELSGGTTAPLGCHTSRYCPAIPVDTGCHTFGY